MHKYRFGELVREVKAKVDRNNNPYEYYIAGDHMDSEDLTIHRRGRFATDDVGPAFIREFKKGQVLYGSRRTYLKKVAVADFDGVTSNTTFVLETKDENIMPQALLPFIMLTDRFTSWSIGKSKGSTNPYILFSDLENYEIELPEIEKQRELARVLWQMFRLKERYNDVLRKSDELIQSQFVEMFGSTVDFREGSTIMPLERIATTQLGKMLNEKKQTGKHQYYYLANRNIRWFDIDFSDLRKMDFDEDERIKYSLATGDLLVCEGGEIGRCAIWHGIVENCYIQNAVHRVRCNLSVILPQYLAYVLYYHSLENGFSDMIGCKATIAHLPAEKLRAMQINVPPIALQEQFAAFAEQLDKSKYNKQFAIKGMREAGDLCA